MTGGLRFSEEWTVAPLAPAERAFHGDDATRLVPASPRELRDMVRHAEVSGCPLLVSGRGAHPWLGEPLPAGAMVVSLERIASVLRYEPDDFTISLRAGCTLSEVDGLLSEQSQDTPTDWPRGARGSVGGLVAAGLPGPRQGTTGPIASSLIGLRGVRTGGAVWSAGGIVVKNVAGYDVSRLLVGSLGTLGPILETHWKLRPRPRARRGAAAAFDTAAEAWALARALCQSGIEPDICMVIDRGQIEATGSLGEPLPPRTGETPAVEVVWLVEGSPSLVEWKAGRARSLAVEHRPVDLLEASPEVAPELLDALTRWLEPSDPLSSTETIVRLVVLPSRAARAAELVRDTMARAPATSVATWADARTGNIAVRGKGPPGGSTGPLRDLAARLAEIGARGQLVFLPAALRRGFPDPFLRPRGGGLLDRVARVFDPAGVFAPGRLTHAGEA